MEPSLARSSLAYLRIGIGLGALLAPRVTGKLFGIDPEANPAAPYLARLFGVRELYMAAPFVMPTPALDQAELAGRGVPVDAVDAVAALAAGIRGYLPWRAALPAAAIAGSATYLGSIAATNENRLTPAA